MAERAMRINSQIADRLARPPRPSVSAPNDKTPAGSRKKANSRGRVKARFAANAVAASIRNSERNILAPSRGQWFGRARRGNGKVAHGGRRTRLVRRDARLGGAPLGRPRGARRARPGDGGGPRQ